jgi:hypothetical protein
MEFLKQFWLKFGPMIRKWASDVETRFKNEKIDQKNVEEIKKDLTEDTGREKRKADVGNLLNGSDK